MKYEVGKQIDKELVGVSSFLGKMMYLCNKN